MKMPNLALANQSGAWCWASDASVTRKAGTPAVSGRSRLAATPVPVTRTVPSTGSPAGSVGDTMPTSTRACSPGASVSMTAGTTVRTPGADTVTVSGCREVTQSVPTLTTVTRTICAQRPGAYRSREVVVPASVSRTAEPDTTGCRDSAKTCRLATPGAGAAVLGRLIETAVRFGSSQTGTA